MADEWGWMPPAIAGKSLGEVKVESKKLGRFEVQTLIGKGAMGSVYKAFDPKLKRVVAIKTINLDLIDEDAVRREMFQRFNREAQICASLRHPNVAAIYDVGEFEDTPFLTMEFVDGKPLSKFIGAEDRLDFDLSCRILHDIASGLDYAHAQGVVHRDIKPSNILISKENQAIIVDFGIAKIGEHKMTKSGVYLGTPTYSSPEQIKGQPVDFRTDIFSFGVLAHELVTNRTPYPGDSVNSILFKIVHEPPLISPPLSLSEYDETELKRVFEKVMHADPKQRYQSCTVFAGELIFGLKNQAVPEGQTSSPRVVPEAADTAGPTELMSPSEAAPTEILSGADDASPPTELLSDVEKEPSERVASPAAHAQETPESPRPMAPLLEDAAVVGADQPRTQWIWISAVCLALVAVAVFAVWFSRQPSSPQGTGGPTQQRPVDTQTNLAGDDRRDDRHQTQSDPDNPSSKTSELQGASGHREGNAATQTDLQNQDVEIGGKSEPPPVEKVEDLADDIAYLKQSVREFRTEVQTNKNFASRADRISEKLAKLERSAANMAFRHQQDRLQRLEDEFRKLEDDYREAKRRAAEQIRNLTKD